MRKILFTERQIKNIIGEDFVCYLDKSVNGQDFPKDSLEATGNEVLTKDPDATDNPTMDKIATQKSKSFPFYMRSMYGTLREEKNKKKELNERSYENSNFKVTPSKSAKSNPDEKNTRLNTLDVRLHREKKKIHDMEPNTPEYERSKKKISALKHSIGRGSSTINNLKDAESNFDINSTITQPKNKVKRTNNNNTIYYEQD